MLTERVGTFAANLAKRGMPIHCIQTLLGHEEPQQTRLYSDARKEMYDEYM
ncbi:tyrosine-type recombinase/integrase [Neobacillus drentensis]|uniref:tyrosine-type recombinase/integrase n=1 Tax=Neobacillus drentensis TaxID=220684 RepID=UPI002FFE4655